MPKQQTESKPHFTVAKGKGQHDNSPVGETSMGAATKMLNEQTQRGKHEATVGGHKLCER